jgi:hypothetical protein
MKVLSRARPLVRDVRSLHLFYTAAHCGGLSYIGSNELSYIGSNLRRCSIWRFAGDSFFLKRSNVNFSPPMSDNLFDRRMSNIALSGPLAELHDARADTYLRATGFAIFAARVIPSDGVGVLPSDRCRVCFGRTSPAVEPGVHLGQQKST